MGDGGRHYFEDSYTSSSTPVGMKAFPIAAGPCKIYHRPTSSRLARCCPFCTCCCVSHRNYNGLWRDCYIKLFSDSTLKIYTGSNNSSELVLRIVLKHLYKEISFGDELMFVMDRPDAPQTILRSWDSVLAIPDEPYCNGNINWLDFTTQETLNKWLVAICSTLPARQLRGMKRSCLALDGHRSVEPEQESDSLGLRSHIEIFFGRRPSYGKTKKKTAYLIDMSRSSFEDDKVQLHNSNTVSDAYI
ncbi:hypothetical protein Btru_068492 [Bulinus truncatus]|nr:hypothetical protein Btru_068492 [Bulinus truncatus]